MVNWAQAGQADYAHYTRYHSLTRMLFVTTRLYSTIIVVESSSATKTSLSGGNGMSWTIVRQITAPCTSPKLVLVLKNYAFTIVNNVYTIVRQCKGFHNIVIVQSSLLLPHQQLDSTFTGITGTKKTIPKTPFNCSLKEPPNRNPTFLKPL